MPFADIHLHALFGCDDGAKTAADMFAMVDRAYERGTRVMCLTPHYHPGFFRENREQAERAFEILKRYAARKYPGLRLHLGNELRWDRAAAAWLQEGRCRSIGSSRYVLVDFSSEESRGVIEDGLRQLMNGGYTPVLAHVERYRCMRGRPEDVRALRDKGVVIQMDAGAPLGQYGLRTRFWSRRLLDRHLVDVICSDGHDTDRYPPDMDGISAFLERRYHAAYERQLCWDNACMLLNDTFERG